MFAQLKNAFSSRIKCDAIPPVNLKEKRAGGGPKISMFTKPNKDDKKANSTDREEKKKEKDTNTVNKVVFSNCSGLHLGNKHYNNFTKVVNNNYSKKTDTYSDSKVESDPTIISSREIPEEVKKAFSSIKMVMQSDFDIVKTFVFDWKKLKERLCPYMTEVPENLREEEDWIQANARSGTVGMLCSDLWEIGEAHAAKKLAIAHS